MPEHPPSIYDDDFWRDSAPMIDHGGFGMTPVQKKTMDALVSYIAQHGYSPTYEELRILLGQSSKSRTFDVIEDLVDMRLVRRKNNRARSLFPTHKYLKFHKAREIDKIIIRLGYEKSIMALLKYEAAEKKRKEN